MKKIIALGLIGGALALTGCIETGKPTEYLEGTVIREAGTLPGLVKSPEGIIANETVKLGTPTYILQIETSNGVYTANIYNHYSTQKTIEGLETAVEVGTKVKFVRKTDLGNNFDSDKIGKLYTSEIEVLR